MQQSLIQRAMWLALMAVLLFSSTARAENFQVYPSEKLVFEVVPGTVSAQVLKIENTTNADLTIDAMLEGTVGFKHEIPKQFVLKAYESREFAISFFPNGTTGVEGYLLFTDGQTTVRIALSGAIKDPTGGSVEVNEYVTFGPVAAGKSECRQIEVTNVSKAPVTIEYMLAGYSKGFNLPTDGEHKLTLGAGEKANVNVCYQPGANEYDAKEELIWKYSYDGSIVQKASTWLFGMIEREVDPNLPCLATNERIGIGPVMFGQTGQGMIYLLNQTAEPITITGVQISGEGSSSFSMGAVFPITIAAHSKGELSMNFTPQSDLQTQYSAEAVLLLESANEKCDIARVTFYGWTTEKVREDTRHPIFIDERKTIGIEWGANTNIQKVIFYNNLDHDVEIREVKLRDGIDFSIAETSPLVPCVLKPDESIVVVLTTGTNMKAYFTDEIIFVTDQSSAGDQKYDIQGAMPTASVWDAGNSEIELFVGPNPAQRDVRVNVGNAMSVKIALYDLRGTKIAETNEPDLLWQVAEKSAGSYFVLVTGVTTSGKPFNMTRRFIVE